MPKLIDKCNDISIKIQTGYFEASQFDPKIDMENIYLKIKIVMEIRNKDMRVFLFWCQSIFHLWLKMYLLPQEYTKEQKIKIRI